MGLKFFFGPAAEVDVMCTIKCQYLISLFT